MACLLAMFMVISSCDKASRPPLQANQAGGPVLSAISEEHPEEALPETSVLFQPEKRELTWVGCGITKKAFMSALARAWRDQGGVPIKLQGGGATRGIRDVAAGRADMGGTCRHKIASPLEVDCELHPVGWDALVVVVHPDNPLEDISIGDLRRIFLGELRDWSELGWVKEPIKLMIRRGRESGVGLMGRELLFAQPTMNYTSRAIPFPSSGPLEKSLESTSAGIALTGISSARKRQLKVVRLGGLLPTRQTLKAARYPLARPLYLVTAVNPSPQVARFLDFVQGPMGQATISREGTITLREGQSLWEPYRRQVAATGGLAR